MWIVNFGFDVMKLVGSTLIPPPPPLWDAYLSHATPTFFQDVPNDLFTGNHLYFLVEIGTVKVW